VLHPPSAWRVSVVVGRPRTRLPALFGERTLPAANQTGVARWRHANHVRSTRLQPGGRRPKSVRVASRPNRPPRNEPGLSVRVRPRKNHAPEREPRRKPPGGARRSQPPKTWERARLALPPKLCGPSGSLHSRRVISLAPPLQDASEKHGGNRSRERPRHGLESPRAASPPARSRHLPVKSWRAFWIAEALVFLAENCNFPCIFPC
jgi:hypothetical protein